MITTLQTTRTRHVDARKQQQRSSIVDGRAVDAAATAQRATPTEIRRPGSRCRRLWYPSLKRTPSVATPTLPSPRERGDTPDRGAECELWQRRSSWKTLTGIPVSRRGQKPGHSTERLIVRVPRVFSRVSRSRGGKGWRGWPLWRVDKARCFRGGELLEQVAEHNPIRTEYSPKTY